MRKAIFHYPKEFVTLPEYTQHAGQVVEVGEIAQEESRDSDGGLNEERMFHITAKDGWKGEAFESELEILDEVTP